MLNDFRDCENDTQVDADICIIGAGAAGIAIAREFLGLKVRVILLESGGIEPEPATDLLKQGESVGLSHNGLTEGRNRLLGGTTRVWGGQCLRMDDIDFEARPWVPESGWPIKKADLDSYYSRAESFFGILGEVYDERLWQKFGVKPHEIRQFKSEVHHLRTLSPESSEG